MPGNGNEVYTMHDTIVNADCIKTMTAMPDNYADAIITDPPYELNFMSCSWDRTGIAFSPTTWTQALRVAKPGAHLLAFGGSRTYHRLTCAIEDAGWEIRDCIMWLYGSGMPKSKNLSGQWQGFGTALKPAFEPIILARKPFSGTVDANVRAHGCGVLNIDACRVPAEKPTGWSGAASSGYGGRTGIESGGRPVQGRWPANVIHDSSPEIVTLCPADSGGQSAARFFYSAKASKSDRDEGLESTRATRQDLFHMKNRNPLPKRNLHPTVKPTALMRYLVRLVTPPGGLVLDPFAGSGSTGKATVLEGFKFLGIEKEKDYAKIAQKRIRHAQKLAHAGA